MGVNVRNQCFGEWNSSVFLALAIMNSQYAFIEIQAMNMQIQAFEQAESASIEQFGNEIKRIVKFA